MPKPLPEKMKVLGHSLAYHRSGHGTPVLLVHGITTYSFIWDRIREALSEHHEVVAVDLLGCGASDQPLDVDFGIRSQAERLEAFTQALGWGPFSFVGHDIGGGIAQRFAVDYPERLTHAAVLNGVAYDFWPVQPIIAMRTPIIRQLAMATLDLGAFRLIVQRGVHHRERVTDELMAAFEAPMKSREGRKAFLHFAECLDNRDLTSIAEGLRRTRIPFLVVRGTEDVYLSAEIAHKLHREVPSSRLVEIPEAGHFLQVDQPERVSRELEAFLGP